MAKAESGYFEFEDEGACAAHFARQSQAGKLMFGFQGNLLFLCNFSDCAVVDLSKNAAAFLIRDHRENALLKVRGGMGHLNPTHDVSFVMGSHQGRHKVQVAVRGQGSLAVDVVHFEFTGDLAEKFLVTLAETMGGLKIDLGNKMGGGGLH